LKRSSNSSTQTISLDEGSEIYEEGQELLAEIRNLLHEDEGEIIKIE